MVNNIYGVSLNGAFDRIFTYKVLKETPKTYIVDKITGGHIRKAAMCDRWENYYTDKEGAENFLRQLLEIQDRAAREPDMDYIHRRLLRIKDGVNVVRYTDDLIRYVESFINS